MIRMSALTRLIAMVLAGAALSGCADVDPARTTGPATSIASARSNDDLDAVLRSYLSSHAFTGRVAETIETRLGRRIDPQLADLGRMLWFDPIQGLNDDNTCA